MSKELITVVLNHLAEISALSQEGEKIVANGITVNSRREMDLKSTLNKANELKNKVAMVKKKKCRNNIADSFYYTKKLSKS